MESQPDKTRDLSNVPTGMENDPGADEQVIDQTKTEVNNVPEDADTPDTEPAAGEETAPTDDFVNALAYALDGSGTGMAGAPPAAPPVGDEQKVISEGTTGAGPDDEEDQ